MKETRKQIRAQLVNEVRRQYDRQMQQLRQAVDLWKDKWQAARSERRDMAMECGLLREENESLKQKVAKYEEWVERMQDFCNLPEEERSQAFRTYMDGIRSRMERDGALHPAAETAGSDLYPVPGIPGAVGKGQRPRR